MMIIDIIIHYQSRVWGQKFNVYKKEVSYSHQGIIYLIK